MTEPEGHPWSQGPHLLPGSSGIRRAVPSSPDVIKSSRPVKGLRTPTPSLQAELLQVQGHLGQDCSGWAPLPRRRGDQPFTLGSDHRSWGPRLLHPLCHHLAPVEPCAVSPQGSTLPPWIIPEGSGWLPVPSTPDAPALEIRAFALRPLARSSVSQVCPSMPHLSRSYEPPGILSEYGCFLPNMLTGHHSRVKAAQHLKDLLPCLLRELEVAHPHQQELGSP